MIQACQEGHSDIIDLFIRFGAKLNIKTRVRFLIINACEECITSFTAREEWSSVWIKHKP